MLNLLEDIVGPDYAPAAFGAAIVIIALIALFAILAMVRRMRSGTYVAGGRNRKARLSVMDAAAIDTHRRLVLVRRDDVEHLLLIGGNSDLVVERDIRLSTQPRRAAPAPEASQEEPSAAPPPRVATPAPRPAPQPATPAPRPATFVSRTPAPSVPAPSRPSLPVRAGAPSAKTKDQLDDDLMKELESALDIDEGVPEVAPPKARPSLDDEMAKLLGELTNHKR